MVAFGGNLITNEFSAVHTHTHTHRERERERESYVFKPYHLDCKQTITCSTNPLPGNVLATDQTIIHLIGSLSHI